MVQIKYGPCGEASATCGGNPETRRIVTPAIDIYQGPNETVLTADLPGVDQDGIGITIEKSVMTIVGSGSFSAPEGFESTWNEFDKKDFRRSFRLSEDLDQDNISASVKDGVITVRLPRKQASTPRKIEVKAD